MTTTPAEPPSPHRRLGLGLLLFLAAVELPLAFRAGAYFPRSWMPVALVVAAVALVMVASGPAPRLTRVQGALLAVLLFQAVWTIASLLWAGSRANAWEEADRTLFYLVGAGLATVAVGWAGPHGLRALTFAVLAAIGVVGAGSMVRLTFGGNVFLAFTGDRLHYPVTYWNGLAALLMMGFWLALCLGTAGTQAWWRRSLLVAVAAMLVGLAVLPESRGALWTFFIVLPCFVVLTPHRFRGLVNLGVVVGLTAIAWPALIGVWALRNGPTAKTLTAVVGNTVTEAAFGGAVHHALLAILLCGLAAFAVSAAVSAIESRISPLDRRWVRRIGVALVVIALVGAGLGAFAFQRAEGDLTAFAHRAWNQFTSDQGPSDGSGSRFTDVGLNGRLSMWRVAARAVSERPLLGLGAQNYEFYFFSHRTTSLAVRHSHSQPMQLLADLGLPGAAAYGLFIVGTLFLGVRLRFRAGRPENQAAVAAALLAVGSWVVHSSADWLWQLGSVTWPAVLLLGALLAAGGGRSGDGASAGAEDAAAGARRANPPGVSPVLVRVAVAGVALLLLLSGSASYLSLRYLATAAKSSGPSASAIAAAAIAGRLNPFSPGPSTVMASAYAQAARGAQSSRDIDMVLADLAFAVGAWEEATKREPLAWAIHYSAGLAILEYRDAALAAGILGSRGGEPQPPSAGAAERTGAPSGIGPATPVALRRATREELDRWAREHLQEARRLNPMEDLVVQALARINE